MRNTFVFAAALAAGLLFGGCATDTDFNRDPAMPTHDPAATSWHEDELPDEMYAWIDENGGDLKPAKGKIDGHENCWLAIADTTLVMCPDGFTSTS